MTEKTKLKRLFETVTSLRFLLGTIVVLQVITLLFAISPINLISGLNTVQVVNEVASVVSVPPGEVPVLAVIGDGNIPDIEELKKQNDFNALVYANARNGDYILGYSNQMVIYRRPTRQIIYQGETPVKRYEAAAAQLSTEISDAAKAQGLLANTSEEKPDLVELEDVAAAQAKNATFYANAKKGDVVAVYNQAELILIYRRDGKQIINTGKVNTSIQ